jgi:hypothetical protein
MTNEEIMAANGGFEYIIRRLVLSCIDAQPLYYNSEIIRIRRGRNDNFDPSIPYDIKKEFLADDDDDLSLDSQSTARREQLVVTDAPEVEGAADGEGNPDENADGEGDGDDALSVGSEGESPDVSPMEHQPSFQGDLATSVENDEAERPPSNGVDAAESIEVAPVEPILEAPVENQDAAVPLSEATQDVPQDQPADGAAVTEATEW